VPSLEKPVDYDRVVRSLAAEIVARSAQPGFTPRRPG